MKKIIYILIGICFSALLAKSQTQTQTQSFDADGIKVIFKPTTKNVINVRIYFRGGVTNYPANQAGIENITLDATTKCGTKKYSATAFKDTLDKYGISMYGASTYDYGFIQVNCVAKYFNQAWDLFSDAVVNPSFENNEVKLLEDKTIALIKEGQSNPYVRFEKLQIKNAFANTPYAIDPAGNQETLKSFNADDLKNFYNTLLNKNKIFIVVVGNISKQELFEKVLYSLNIPSKPCSAPDLRTPVLNDNKLLIEKEAMATNYVGAIMNAPEFTTISYIPFQLGIAGLSGNLYAYLKTYSGLSYLPYAKIVPLRMPYVVMSAGTTNVHATMAGMLNKLKQIQTGGLNDEWLQHLKNIFLTTSYINDQSAASITAHLGSAEILGNWQYADDFTKLVDMVTVDQVNYALNYYIVGLRWTFLGNLEAIENFKPPVY